MAPDGNFFRNNRFGGWRDFSALISMKRRPSRNQLAKRQRSGRDQDGDAREKPAHHSI